MKRLTAPAVMLFLLAGCGTSGSGDNAAACKQGYVRSSYSHTCVRAGDPNFGETRSGEREHTPEEEQKRRDNLDAEAKASHEEEALENSSGGRKACEEEKRTQEKLHYENPNAEPEPQREYEYEQLCHS